MTESTAGPPEVPEVPDTRPGIPLTLSVFLHDNENVRFTPEIESVYTYPDRAPLATVAVLDGLALITGQPELFDQLAAVLSEAARALRVTYEQAEQSGSES